MSNGYSGGTGGAFIAAALFGYFVARSTFSTASFIVPELLVNTLEVNANNKRPVAP